jgi:predicted DsbA family dithiol-disulfide isomerase
MAARFPDRAHLTQVHETLVALAQALGAPLDLGRIAITPNTLGAHQLIRAALASGRQDAVVDAVMTAYFAEGRDIGDPEVLCDIGEAHGLSRMTVLEALCDEAGARSVAVAHATASDAGITGVPFAIFDGLMSVAGAQSPERYGLALSKAASKRAVCGD